MNMGENFLGRGINRNTPFTPGMKMRSVSGSQYPDKENCMLIEDDVMSQECSEICLTMSGAVLA